MKTVAEAQAVILQHAEPLIAREHATAAALGLTLAETIQSDIDSPPHDKSVVDGYAVCSADFAAAGNVRLKVVEEVTAGNVPQIQIIPGTATRIMTGAPLPAGADAVVMVEQTTLAGDLVEICEPRFYAGMNITRRASSIRKNAVVLQAGIRLRGIELGVLAEVGRTAVLTIPAPRVAIVATGNELVPAAQFPAAGQIRNSNEPMLAGFVRECGGESLPLGIARDSAASLGEKINAGLSESDVLILSGGVSAGVLDLVPETLLAAGVTEVFHKVNLKPGKPLWFGVRRRDHQPPQLVFGLPGNPVSSLVCFMLFVRPALAKLAGKKNALPTPQTAILTREMQLRGERVTYWPAEFKTATTERNDDWPQITPLPWQGSGDLFTLTQANALAIFPQPGIYAAGTTITAIPL